MTHILQHGNDFAERLQGKNVREDLDADTEAILAAVDAYVAELEWEARIQENQTPLDRINGYHPKATEITSASFGSASGAIELASWKRYFEDRIEELERLRVSKPNNDEQR